MGARWRADLSADGVDAAFIERRAPHQPRPHHRRARAGRGLRLPGRDGRLPRPPPPGRRMADGRAEHRPGLPESASGSAPIRPRRLLDVPPPCSLPNWCGMPSACPHSWHPQALITLGYAAEEKQRERLPLAERVIWR